MYSLLIHVAPRRTSISDASRSLGCAAFKARTFASKYGDISAASSASRSFCRTLPERYSSAVTYVAFPSSSRGPGTWKITPVRSSAISSSSFPVNSAIKGRSTFAFSAMETASASDAVSTCSIVCCWRIVRLVNMSALRSMFPSSSSTSSEQSR